MRSLLSSLNLSSFVPQLKSSCMGQLGRSENTPEALTARTESIRQLMLRELGEYGERKFPAVTHRVRYSPDVLGLWYARSDVMAILTNRYGETVAREKITRISGCFNGLLPKSLTRKTGFRLR